MAAASIILRVAGHTPGAGLGTSVVRAFSAPWWRYYMRRRLPGCNPAVARRVAVVAAFWPMSQRVIGSN